MIATEMPVPHKLCKLRAALVVTLSSKTAGKLVTLSKIIMTMTTMVKSTRSEYNVYKRRSRRNTTESMNKKHNSLTKRKKRKKSSDQIESM